MTDWKRVGYLKTSDAGPFSEHTWRYHLDLPSPLNEWDVWDYWERSRTEHMAATLQSGDVLYDVGAEHGWQSCVYGQMVGSENVVLVEPSPPMWPNIRQTWERNLPGPPLATAQVLLGSTPGEAPIGAVVLDGWPSAADGPMADRVSYRYLHEHADRTPVLTLDALTAQVGRAPDAVTVDVEGAELVVLQGAVETLREHHPRVWVSIHPDLMSRDYGTAPWKVHELMAECGYWGALCIGVDHEEHWYFEAAQ